MAKRFETASLVLGQGSVGQDRAAVFSRDDVVVGVVADGAGGTSGGAAAATLLIEIVRQAVERGDGLLKASVWRQVLLEAGVELEGIGQTTAVVVSTNGATVCGASVGDSGAWVVQREGSVDLTEGQPRKPLLGGGLAEPLVFAQRLRDSDTLLLATDGLLKYAKADLICAAARRECEDVPTDTCCAEIARLPRLPNGNLQDDVGLVLIRWERVEVQLAASARAWMRQVAGGVDAPTPSPAERDFTHHLERWLEGLLPETIWRERAGDGLGIHEFRLDANNQLKVCGWMYEVAGQNRFPFEVHLDLAVDRCAGFTLLFGDAGAVAGSADSKFIALGTPREWLFRAQGPEAAR